MYGPIILLIVIVLMYVHYEKDNCKARNKRMQAINMPNHNAHSGNEGGILQIYKISFDNLQTIVCVNLLL